MKEELGLPNGAKLTADLHSLLVYEPNQFFLAHQDSEKDDSMVGTLVVTLPSSYAGGELMVGHNEEWQAYRGSKTALSLVAFYAGCRHEVLRVKSGYRITLTYNLLLHGDTSREGDYDIKDLIDSEVTLTHWTGPELSRLEETSLCVGSREVCASTPTGALTPYSTEYEGYMGNWGNTLDRWYHRAAVIVWPREQAFANRAEASPDWALAEIAAMASAGGVPGAQTAAATLAPCWDTTLGRQPRESRGRIFGPALQAAEAVADAETAATLLRPFRIEDMDRKSADSFGKIAGRYGQPWTAELVRTWFSGRQAAWAYGYGQDRPQWIADQLPGLCARLNASGRDGVVAAKQLVDLAWEWAARETGAGLASSSPSRRDEKLGELGRPLASLLMAAAAIGAASTRDTILGYAGKQGDAVTALEMPALRAAAEIAPDPARGEAGFGDLAANCAARLRARLARPRRAPGDWSIELPAGDCACELCGPLGTFLADRSRRTFEWPLAKERRRHVHARIDGAELPVSHVTRRQGRPYTLVLTKTDALFARELQERARDETDLEWLTARWTTPPR